MSTITTTNHPGRGIVKVDKDGTSWSIRTPDELIEVLRAAHGKRTKLHISYGFTDQEGKPTGKNWLEEYDCCGYIGRSTGSSKIPLLLETKRSTGGCALLDSSIVRVIRTRDGAVLWQHPSYHQGLIKVEDCDFMCDNGRRLYCQVTVDGKVHARFKDRPSANRWLRALRVQAD